MALTDKQVYDLNNMNKAAQNAELGTLLKNGGNGGSDVPNSNLPIGTVVMFSGNIDSIPDDWHICDGADGTPDLRGRFVLGVSDTHNFGDTGGLESVALKVSHLPSHTHSLYKVATSGNKYAYVLSTQATYGSTFTTSGISQGGGVKERVPTMPPYYTLYYIIKIK